MSPPSSPAQHAPARQFWAFISYRHDDNRDEGRQWATWLHQAIETYEVPADLVGTRNRRGDIIPERIFPVFGDEEELAVDADLAGPIYTALDNSRCLIVICSPGAATSQYVADEVAYFKRTRSDQVLAVMVDGEPGIADREARAVGVEECFPRPLRFEVDPDGNVTDRPAEPVAADFRLLDEAGRPDQGWTSPEALRQELEQRQARSEEVERKVAEYRSRLDLMRLKTIAGILALPLGTLTKRDRAYQLELAARRARTLRRWLVALAILAVAALAGGLLALQQKNEADIQRNEAELQKAEAQRNAQEARRNLSNQLASEGLDYLSEGRTREGLATLDSSLRGWPGNPVARQRLLYELLYRRWTVAADVVPAPVPLELTDPAARPRKGSEGAFRVVSAGEDGTIELEQYVVYDTDDAYGLRAARRASYRPAEKRWVLGELRARAGREPESVMTLELRNGIEITAMAEEEGEPGTVYSTFEASRNGAPHSFKIRGDESGSNVVPHGFVDADDDHSRLVFAGAGDTYESQTVDDKSTIVIALFDARNLELIHRHVIHTNGRTALQDVRWLGNHIVVESVTKGWESERIDVVEVSDTGTDTTLVIEDFAVKDRAWAWHDGTLYVRASHETGPRAFVVGYRPMQAVMSRWSADEYRGGELSPFAAQRLEGKAFGPGVADDDTGVGVVRGKAERTTAYSADGRNITIATEDDRVIGVLASEVDAHSRNLSGLAFSEDERSLVVTAEMPEVSGNRVDWEMFDVATGMQVLPITAFGFWRPDPEDYLHAGPSGHLKPFAWTVDGRSLVFGLFTRSGAISSSCSLRPSGASRAPSSSSPRGVAASPRRRSAIA